MHPDLHDQRVSFVTGLLLHSGARRVLELGCGGGRLLAVLAQQAQFTQLTGVDSSASALAVARDALASAVRDGRLVLVHGDAVQPQPVMGAVDAVVMVEVIEHLEPSRLSAAESTVFGHYAPALVLITTPNVEYNPLFGLRPGSFRDPDHRFEWPRGRFRGWANGLAQRHGYQAQLGGIGDPHPEFGHPTQYALFRR